MWVCLSFVDVGSSCAMYVCVTEPLIKQIYIGYKLYNCNTVQLRELRWMKNDSSAMRSVALFVLLDEDTILFQTLSKEQHVWFGWY